MRLLEMLFEATVADPPRRLNQYAIATLALQRNERFDPQQSSIVRVEMRRVRLALDRYYATSGKADRIRFSLRQRLYLLDFAENVLTGSPEESGEGSRPHDRHATANGFVHSTPTVSAFTKVKPSVCILTNNDNCDDPLLCALVAAALNFDFFDVRELHSSAASLASGFDYRLRLLRLPSDEGEVLVVRLSSPHNSRIFDARLPIQAGLGNEDVVSLATSDLIFQVMTLVFSHHGAIADDLITQAAWRDKAAGLCLLMTRYFNHFDSSMIDEIEAGAFAQQNAAAYSSFAAILMAYVFLNRVWVGPAEDRQENVSRAMVWSVKATALAPRSSHATYVRALAEHYRGNVDEANRLAALALTQNPNDCIIIGGNGHRQLHLGNLAEAKTLIGKAYRHLGMRPSSMSMAMGVIAVVEDDLSTAAATATELEDVSFPVAFAIRIVAAAMAGDCRQVEQISSAAISRFGGTVEKFVAHVSPVFVHPGIRDAFLTRLCSALGGGNSSGNA